MKKCRYTFELWSCGTHEHLIDYFGLCVIVFQTDTGDDVLPPVLRELIGTKHVFEIKGHTYYQFGDYESFNCSQVIIPAIDSLATTSASKQEKVMKIGSDSSVALTSKVEMVATPAKKGEHNRRKL